MYYDRQGRPIHSLEWTSKFEDLAYKRVLYTKTPHGYKWVSTVWLGLDHSFGGDEPLIFETMVFRRKDFTDLEMDRYTTEQQAIEGHWRLVQRWRYNRRQRRAFDRRRHQELQEASYG